MPCGFHIAGTAITSVRHKRDRKSRHGIRIKQVNVTIERITPIPGVACFLYKHRADDAEKLTNFLSRPYQERQ
jgi:hypothetical protein